MGAIRDILQNVIKNRTLNDKSTTINISEYLMVKAIQEFGMGPEITNGYKFQFMNFDIVCNYYTDDAIDMDVQAEMYDHVSYMSIGGFKKRIEELELQAAGLMGERDGKKDGIETLTKVCAEKDTQIGDLSVKLVRKDMLIKDLKKSSERLIEEVTTHKKSLFEALKTIKQLRKAEYESRNPTS